MFPQSYPISQLSVSSVKCAPTSGWPCCNGNANSCRAGLMCWAKLSQDKYKRVLSLFLKKKLKTIRARVHQLLVCSSTIQEGTVIIISLLTQHAVLQTKLLSCFSAKPWTCHRSSDTSSSWSYLFFKDELKARQSWEGNPLVTVSSIIHAKQPAAVERLLCSDVIMMHFNEELISSAPKSHCLRSHRCCWMRPGGLLSKLPSQFLGGDCLAAQCIDYLFWGSIQSVSFNALFVWKRQEICLQKFMVNLMILRRVAFFYFIIFVSDFLVLFIIFLIISHLSSVLFSSLPFLL